MNDNIEKRVPNPILELLPTQLTYAAVVDVRNVEHEITDLMVRRACQEIESEQQFPFGPAPISK